MDDSVRSVRNWRAQGLGCLPTASRKTVKSRIEPAISSSGRLLEEQDGCIRGL